MAAKKLKLEINDELNKVINKGENSQFKLGNTKVMFTPPIGKDYWIFRVQVSEKQAVIGFPKFGSCGVGFQVEDDDWNTNLPSSCETMKLYNWIKCNKRVEGDVHITDRRCIEAVELIQKAAEEYKDAWKNML